MVSEVYTTRECAATAHKADVRRAEIDNVIESAILGASAEQSARGAISIRARSYRCGLIRRYLLSISSASYPTRSNERISKRAVKQRDKPCR